MNTERSSISATKVNAMKTSWTEFLSVNRNEIDIFLKLMVTDDETLVISFTSSKKGPV